VKVASKERERDIAALCGPSPENHAQAVTPTQPSPTSRSNMIRSAISFKYDHNRHFSNARHQVGQKRAELCDVVSSIGGAMILFVGLVLIGGIAVLAGIVGIKWTIAWLVLLGIATIATRESDDDRSGREASPSEGTASAIEAS
jgi:hypothetical protein